MVRTSLEALPENNARRLMPEKGGDRLMFLSLKLARLVEVYAKRLQIQEKDDRRDRCLLTRCSSRTRH